MFNRQLISVFFLGIFVPFVALSETFFVNEEILLFFSLVFMFSVSYSGLSNFIYSNLAATTQSVRSNLNQSLESRLELLSTAYSEQRKNFDLVSTFESLNVWFDENHRLQSQIIFPWLYGSLSGYFNLSLVDLVNQKLAETYNGVYQDFFLFFQRAKKILSVVPVKTKTTDLFFTVFEADFKEPSLLERQVFQWSV